MTKVIFLMANGYVVSNLLDRAGGSVLLVERALLILRLMRCIALREILDRFRVDAQGDAVAEVGGVGDAAQQQVGQCPIATHRKATIVSSYPHDPA